MSGKVIAVANMKGGVGKTVTVVSLAEALAAEGKKVLVVDLDTQASVSFCLAGNEELEKLKENETTITDYLLANISKVGKKPLVEFVRKAISNVSHGDLTLNISLVPSSVELRFIEREIIHQLTEKRYSLSSIEGRTVKMLKGDLPELRSKYDFVIFDCAPGISAFTEVAIRLADLVIIPTIPDRLSTLGLAAFCNSVWRYKGRRKSVLPKPAGLPYVLVTRKQNTKQHKATIARLLAEANKPEPAFFLFDTQIPQLAKIPDAMDLYPNNTDKAYPTYTQKWGELASIMDELNLEIKGALDGARN